MKKILIANRGEIALRIVRACRDAGYISVAIASEADRDGLHARSADECHVLAGNSPLETYLNKSAILGIAAHSGADAIHPGYGLLSENKSFAAAVEDAKFIWIGPTAQSIAQLGDKVSARSIARSVSVPLLPSMDDSEITVEKASKFIADHGLPIIIKAQNGGGGRGMRVVRDASEIEQLLTAAQREATMAFGRPECFIERFVESARHVETQCLADNYGKAIVLSTRDCTLQRRHQKIIEEAPAPFISKEQQEKLVASSIAILEAVHYRGAATCEFLLTSEGDIFFLEVNTRVQVEHPVTEEVTGVDIIRAMFHIAEGGRLDFIVPSVRGHSIEFRINAEDSRFDFRPTPGRITRLRLPGGPGIRNDFGYDEGDIVPPYYDSLIGKLIVTGQNRAEAISRARRALGELVIEGIKTIVPLHRTILESPEFSSAVPEDFSVSTRWIDDELTRLSENSVKFLGQEIVKPAVSAKGADATQIIADEGHEPAYRVGLKAPLSGLVLKVLINPGDRVSIGDPVAIMESMKMEQTVIAEVIGVVARINVVEGSFIEVDEDLLGLD